MTPDEFEEVYLKWSDKREGDIRMQWETTRMVCYHTVVPYMKRKSSIKAFMPLPWEKARKSKKKKDDRPIHDEKRFEKLKAKYGNEIPVHS